MNKTPAASLAVRALLQENAFQHWKRRKYRGYPASRCSLRNVIGEPHYVDRRRRGTKAPADGGKPLPVSASDVLPLDPGAGRRSAPTWLLPRWRSASATCTSRTLAPGATPRAFFGGLQRERIWTFWRRVLHTCHHRTQVQTWLRLAGKHVPAIYGPSGDVTWNEADPTYSLEAAERGA